MDFVWENSQQKLKILPKVTSTVFYFVTFNTNDIFLHLNHNKEILEQLYQCHDSLINQPQTRDHTHSEPTKTKVFQYL